MADLGSIAAMPTTAPPENWGTFNTQAAQANYQNQLAQQVAPNAQAQQAHLAAQTEAQKLQNADVAKDQAVHRVNLQALIDSQAATLVKPPPSAAQGQAMAQGQGPLNVQAAAQAPQGQPPLAAQGVPTSPASLGNLIATGGSINQPTQANPSAQAGPLVVTPQNFSQLPPPVDSHAANAHPDTTNAIDQAGNPLAFAGQQHIPLQDGSTLVVDRAKIMQNLGKIAMDPTNPDRLAAMQAMLGNAAQWKSDDAAAEEKKRAQVASSSTLLANMLDSINKAPEAQRDPMIAQVKRLALAEGADPQAVAAVPDTFKGNEATFTAMANSARTAAQRDTAAHQAAQDEVAGSPEGKIMQDVKDGTLTAAQGNAAIANLHYHAPVSGTGAGTSLTPQAIDTLATQWHSGSVPSFGMGAAGNANRTAVANRMAEMFPATDLASAIATHKSDAGSLAGLQKNRDAVISFENTAGKNLGMFLDLASKIPDAGSPWVNKPLRALDVSGLGSSEVAAANAARQVANNEIAKVTSNPGLGGQLSDSARHEVESYNPSSATFDQAVAVAKVLKQDMANRHEALDNQLAEIKGRLAAPAYQGAGTSTSSPAPKSLPTINSQADYDALPSGSDYLDSNGTKAHKR